MTTPFVAQATSIQGRQCHFSQNSVPTHVLTVTSIISDNHLYWKLLKTSCTINLVVRVANAGPGCSHTPVLTAEIAVA